MSSTVTEKIVVTVEQVLKSDVKHSKRREPLGFAYFALVLFLVVNFARPEDWIPGLGAVPLAKITGIFMFVVLAFSLGKFRWNLPPEVIFLVLLVVQLWLTIPFAIWRGGAFLTTLDFSKVLPVVVVMAQVVLSKKRLRWILFIQAASVATIAIISVLMAHLRGGRLAGVLSGPYGNSNDLALIINMSLPLCLAFALTTRSYWKKFIWAAAMLGLIYAVFLTASRGGALTLVVVALVCLWHLGVKGRRLYLLLLVPIAVIVLWLYGGDSLRGRIERTTMDPATNREIANAEASAQARKEVLLLSLKATFEHPLFGIGPGNFPIISGHWLVTHNSYTQISAEGGIPAFLFYVLILWRAITNLRAVRKSPKTRKEIRLFSMSLEASLAAYLFGSFFASVAYMTFPYCLVAYTSALHFIAQRDRIASSRVQKSDLVPTQVEVTVWQ